MGYIPGSELDSVLEIDDVLQEIAILENKKKHFEALHKRRIEVLKDKIKEFDARISDYRSVILSAMKKYRPDEKTIDFTPIGKVTRKKPRTRWIIENDEEVLAWLDTKGSRDKVVDIIEKINKKKLDAILDKLGKKEEVSGANLDPGKESISIVFEKTYKPTPKNEEETHTTNVPIEEDLSNLSDLVI